MYWFDTSRLQNDPPHWRLIEGVHIMNSLRLAINWQEAIERSMNTCIFHTSQAQKNMILVSFWSCFLQAPRWTKIGVVNTIIVECIQICTARQTTAIGRIPPKSTEQFLTSLQKQDSSYPFSKLCIYVVYHYCIDKQCISAKMTNQFHGSLIQMTRTSLKTFDLHNSPRFIGSLRIVISLKRNLTLLQRTNSFVKIFSLNTGRYV